MGVKLKDLVERVKVDFSQLAGKIVAIDAPNIIMGFLTFSRKNRTENESSLIVDRTQQAISHLYGILYRVNFLYSKNIFPIFCFDGRDSELKRITTKDFLNDFNFTKRRYQDAITRGDKFLAKQIAMGKEYFWPNIILESKRLLNALGVPYIESPASAESQCADLVKKGIADYSNSHDYDSLLFGCPCIIQNLSKSLRRKQQGRWTYTKIEPSLISLDKTLNNLGINHFQLVDLALLMGTDYFPGIKNIGPKKALELVKDYQHIELIIPKLKNKYDFSQITLELVKKVRKLFLFPDVIESLQKICWNPPNRSKIIEFLCEEHYLNKERVENFVNKKFLDNYYNCRTYFTTIDKNRHPIQMSLDTYI
jgi:flap endonuclease-1